ncbi:NnrU family protein [Ramlibacter sp.]|uniref:NnrU family protein n=1 Tax=Ramlibacter sp. TaxID=1917967 RepID=UPI003D0DC346
MAMLVLGLLLFLGVHSLRIVADPWRTATIARIGAMPWKAIYSVVSIVAFAMIVYGYGQARMQIPLWSPPTWTKHLTALLMLPVFPMFLAAYIPRNAIKVRLGHPQILSVKLWALAHLVSNGNLADVLLFGAFLAWAIADFRAARLRDAKAMGSPHDPLWRAPATQAPQLGATVITVVAGLVVYVLFVVWLHAALIGVKPFGAS